MDPAVSSMTTSQASSTAASFTDESLTSTENVDVLTESPFDHISVDTLDLATTPVKPSKKFVVAGFSDIFDEPTK
ncbi:hypothetical protein HK405_015586, partial [Cladochytrium tenue]